MRKKVQVSFSDKQIGLIQQLREELGYTESEIIRTIVACWLVDQGLLQAVVKDKMIRRNMLGSSSE